MKKSIEIMGEQVTKTTCAALTIWVRDGVMFADGLFRLHDQEGFSLTDSLIECKNRGLRPCINQFRADALRAGWTRERIDTVVHGAISDSSTIS